MNFGGRTRLGAPGLDGEEQQRLDEWLDVARSFDTSELEQRGSEVYPQRRSRHVRQLVGSIKLAAESARARKSARWRWSSVAAAAVLALFIGSGGYAYTAGWLASPDAQSAHASGGANLRQVAGKVTATRHDGKNQVVGQDAAVRAGDEISTAARAFASLEGEVARVELSGATTLRLQRLERNTEVFHLKSGRVDVSVPELPGLEREVQVTTEDVVVTVHGTIFSVEVQQGEAGPVTNVEVSRGLVSVQKDRQRVMLSAGQRWSSLQPEQAGPRVETTADAPEAPQPEALQPEAPPPQPGAAQLRASDVRAKLGPAPVRPAPAATPSSDLAEQNALFERALASRDRGDDRAAIVRLERLLSQYPTSPLRATAQVELRNARKRVQGLE